MLTRNPDAAGVADLRGCSSLRRLKASAPQQWPTGALTQLRRLEVPKGRSVDQIPATLASLRVVCTSEADKTLLNTADFCVVLQRG